MTSGNLLADRRLEFARELHARGAIIEAAEILEQALELAPGWVAGRFLLGEWLETLSHRDAAIAAYRRCLELDPADRMGAVLRLALLGAVAVPPAPPTAYVASVFDEYADHFDSALVERLEYRVPERLAALVGSVAGGGARFSRALDLGCGTGLAGERFRAACAWLEGVDLSAGMVAEARHKGFYDTLEVSEATAFLTRASVHYDLVVAADVLVYFGDLVPLAVAVARALAPGGRFAFSVEASDGAGFRLTAGQRYAHSETCVRVVMEGAGLRVEALEKAACRLEAGRHLPAYLVIARKETADTAVLGDIAGVLSHLPPSRSPRT